MPSTLLRDRRDHALLLVPLVHGVALALWPHAVVVGIGLWWNANTVAHQLTHRRLFRSTTVERAFGLLESLLNGVPQRVWRDRHRAHHAGVRARVRLDGEARLQCGVLAAALTVAAWLAPAWLVTAWLPGLAHGLALCALHGHYEHHRGTVSTYGTLWNRVFFNDGFHVEHHAAPGRPWHALPAHRDRAARTSRWPPVLRWLDALPLEATCLDRLERLAIRHAFVRRAVLAPHRRALAALLPRCGPIRTVTIVGGGLFPRTAILLRELLPDAHLTIVDAEPEHLALAARALPPSVTVRIGRYEPGMRLDCDLAVLPLALRGSRAAAYTAPPARWTLVHDWLWRPRGASLVVAAWLLKRVNLVERRAAALRHAG